MAAGNLAVIFGSLKTTLSFAIPVVMILAAMAIGAWFLITWTKYNTKVIILSSRGGGQFKIFMDRGALIKKGGVQYFKLFKRRLLLPPPDLSYLQVAKKGNILFLKELSQDEYIPLMPGIDIDPEDSKLNLKPIDADIRLWMQSMIEKTKEAYGEDAVWKQIAPYAIIGMVSVLSLIIIYVTVQKIDDMIPALQAIATSLKAVASNMGGGPI